MLTLELAAANQEISFEDGSVTNFLRLVLPNGAHVRAVVSDESLQAIIACAQGAPARAPAPPPSPEPPPPPPVEEDDEQTFAPEPEEGVTEFGGDLGGEELESPPETFWPAPPPDALVLNAPAAVAAPVQPREVIHPDMYSTDPMKQQKAYKDLTRQRQANAKKPPSPSRTVQKDSMGYPIVSRSGADPATVTTNVGGAGADEDGISQA